MPLPINVKMFFKKKNLRFIIFLLFLNIFVITILHIYDESKNKKIDPTSTTNSILPIIDEDVENEILADNLDDTPSIQENNNSINQFYSSDASGSYGERRRNYTRRNISQDGKCSPIKTQFIPDFDANILYPLFQFDGNWINNTREYWNNFFEERFQNIKKSNLSPTLKIYVIPHSHNDPGWLKTYQEYFDSKTKYIIDDAVDKLIEFHNMTFQWSEISFLSKWWEYAEPTRRSNLKKLVDEKRFEIVTGGWVMTDEATVHLYSMIDQLIEGHQWVKSHLGIVPTSSWSIDSFGHGSTFPYILKTSGITGMVIQRIHYAWKKWMAEFQKGDFEWTQRWDTTRRNSIFCHNAPFDIYTTKYSCGPHPQICLDFDFRSEDFSEIISNINVKARAELLLEQYRKTASLYPHNIAMISVGGDFEFDRPPDWDKRYLNYMKLFNYINERKEQYRAEVKFGTISEYFNAVQERTSSISKTLPTFSGDFFVYSDTFSDGIPAYWSGYFSTRPFWKKFYRDTENTVRSAEILFTFANALARQKNRRIISQSLNHEYRNLVTARRWLSLFAHHDATTGTSTVKTMNDYGVKLMEAFQIGLNIQILTINSMLFGSAAANNSKLRSDFEQKSFGELPRKIPIIVQTEKRIVLFNNLAWLRSHIVKIFVTSPHVRVIGPNGQPVLAQLNPVFELKNKETTQTEPLLVMSSDTFELSFLVHLPPLSLSTFIILKSSTETTNEAIRANVYCQNCSNLKGIFEKKRIQAGNIQLTNNKLQLLFDKNTGFLLKITKNSTSVKTKLSFGSYTSVDFRSGAYLQMINPKAGIKKIPDLGLPEIFLTSGPIYTELSVIHSPLKLSTRIMHVGGEELEEAIFVTNQVNVGLHNGEVFMRFDTDLDSTSRIVNNSTNPTEFEPIPTFYTDQNGFTVEKRIKISEIRLEGNYYPVTSMSYIEDNIRGLRFSVLVDRAHGFSSFEIGRLEAMIERRTIDDDARGMGEGVTDNKDTISNYVIVLEKISEQIIGTEYKTSSGSNSPSIPTLNAHHLSQNLNYPPSLFIMGPLNKGERIELPPTLYYLINQEFPCDSHLINLRTMTEDDQIYETDTHIPFPSSKALMITQRLGYHCPEIGKIGCRTNVNENNLFYSNTRINLDVLQFTESDLTGINSNSFKNVTNLEQIVSSPFEIKTIIIHFK